MALHPSPELVQAAWRAEDVEPGLAATIAGLAAADPLPGLPGTHWDEAMVMAAALNPQADDFVADLARHNLNLAARCAASPEVALAPSAVDELRGRLLRRSRAPEADLRARIEAGHGLGHLGDPRLRRQEGPAGPCLVPDMVAIPGGSYLLGAPDLPGAAPVHRLTLAPFEIAARPVTNAEYACFVAAGGYDTPRWWDTPASAAWREGQDTSEAARLRERRLRREFLADTQTLDRVYTHGQMAKPVYDRWRERLQWTDTVFETELAAAHPGGRLTAPQHAGDERFNQPGQPVVGVSWFEARAYAAWLAELTGRSFRLPSEAEWEAAARGFAGRSYAWGDVCEAERCNCVDAHVRSTTPVGVFPAGDTPEGLSDLCGNVFEWTSSLWGPDSKAPGFAYPYQTEDGREAAEAENQVLRVLRGGAWDVAAERCHTAWRTADRPDIRGINAGFRLVVG